MTETGGLSIAKATTTSSVSHVGDSIPYTFTVTNTSNVTLTNVGVTDLPISPAGLTSSPVCTGLTSPTASCTSSSSTTLAPGQVATFTASYSVTQADLNNGSINDKSSAAGTNPPNIGGTVTRDLQRGHRRGGRDRRPLHRQGDDDQLGLPRR